MHYIINYPEILVSGKDDKVEMLKLTNERINFQSVLKDGFIKTYAYTYTTDNSKPVWYTWIKPDMPFNHHIWISNHEFWK